MKNQRRAKRTRSAQTIRVTNSITGENAGQVGNLSERGMMLVTREKVGDEALFQFAFELPDQKGRQRQIEVGVQENWSSAANLPNHYWVGFQFIDIAPEAAMLLSEWLEEPANHVG